VIFFTFFSLFFGSTLLVGSQLPRKGVSWITVQPRLFGFLYQTISFALSFISSKNQVAFIRVCGCFVILAPGALSFAPLTLSESLFPLFFPTFREPSFSPSFEVPGMGFLAYVLLWQQKPPDTAVKWP